MFNLFVSGKFDCFSYIDKEDIFGILDHLLTNKKDDTIRVIYSDYIKNSDSIIREYCDTRKYKIQPTSCSVNYIRENNDINGVVIFKFGNSNKSIEKEVIDEATSKNIDLRIIDKI